MKKSSKTIYTLILFIALGTFLFSGYKLLAIRQQYRTDAQVYTDLSDKYSTTQEPVSITMSTPKPKMLHIEDPGENEKLKTHDVNTEVSLDKTAPDFTALKSEVNEEIIGWIYYPDTNPLIDYPIVQHDGDNRYYLKHNIYNQYTDAGSIFVCDYNKPDFSDDNTVIYGHHLYNGTMFGNLKKWLDKEWFEAHPVFYIFTDETLYQISPFAYVITPDESYIYTPNFASIEEKRAWTEQVIEESAMSIDYEFMPGDKFITLSTCMYNFENARGVLIGYIIPVEI